MSPAESFVISSTCPTKINEPLLYIPKEKETLRPKKYLRKGKNISCIRRDNDMETYIGCMRREKETYIGL